MSLIIAKAKIETSNDNDIDLILIGGNTLQITSLFAEYLDKLTSEPIAIHAHLLDDDATVKSAKAHIQTAYIDDHESLIFSKSSKILSRDEIENDPNAVQFLKAIERGFISNEYIEEMHKLLGEDSPKSPWINRNHEEAPKTGETLYAVDSVHGHILFTLHYSDGDFMTENESWSGSFLYWMPAIGYPEDYLSFLITMRALIKALFLYISYDIQNIK